MFPGISGPGVVAFFSWFRHRLEAPHFRSRAHVVRRDPAVGPELVRRGAENHLVLDDQRRDVQLKSRFPVEQRLVPESLSGLRIDRNQVSIVGRPEQAIVREGEPFHDHHVRVGLRRHAVSIGPEVAAGRSIERDDFAVLNRVQDAVNHDRRALHLVEIARPPHPLERQALHVVARDLVEEAVSLTRVGPAVGEPVLRLAFGAEDPISTDPRLACACSGHRGTRFTFESSQVGDNVGELRRRERVLE